MSDQPPPYDDLYAWSESADFASLQTDLELCWILVDFAADAERKVDDLNSVLQAREKAEMGYVAINRLVAKLEDPTDRKQIQLGLYGIREALDQLAVRD